MAAIAAAFLVGLVIPTGGGPGTEPATQASSGSPVGALLGSPASSAGPTTYTVAVTTEGTSTVGNLMWGNGQGGMETRENRPAPFRETVTVGDDRPWETVQITAQLPIDAEAGASISCAITDSAGRTLDTQTSRGLYAVATCNSAGL